MRIAATVFTAKRSNKFLVLRKEGMLVHNRPHLQRECGACPPSSALARTPPSRSPDQATMVLAEDGRERAPACARRGTGNPTGTNKGATLDSRALCLFCTSRWSKIVWM